MGPHEHPARGSLVNPYDAAAEDPSSGGALRSAAVRALLTGGAGVGIAVAGLVLAGASAHADESAGVGGSPSSGAVDPGGADGPSDDRGAGPAGSGDGSSRDDGAQRSERSEREVGPADRPDDGGGSQQPERRAAARGDAGPGGESDGTPLGGGQPDTTSQDDGGEQALRPSRDRSAEDPRPSAPGAGSAPARGTTVDPRAAALPDRGTRPQGSGPATVVVVDGRTGQVVGTAQVSRRGAPTPAPQPVLGTAGPQAAPTGTPGGAPTPTAAPAAPQPAPTGPPTTTAVRADGARRTEYARPGGDRVVEVSLPTGARTRQVQHADGDVATLQEQPTGARVLSTRDASGAGVQQVLPAGLVLPATAVEVLPTDQPFTDVEIDDRDGTRVATFGWGGHEVELTTTPGGATRWHQEAGEEARASLNPPEPPAEGDEGDDEGDDGRVEWKGWTVDRTVDAGGELVERVESRVGEDGDGEHRVDGRFAVTADGGTTSSWTETDPDGSRSRVVESGADGSVREVTALDAQLGADQRSERRVDAAGNTVSRLSFDETDLGNGRSELLVRQDADGEGFVRYGRQGTGEAGMRYVLTDATRRYAGALPVISAGEAERAVRGGRVVTDAVSADGTRSLITVPGWAVTGAGDGATGGPRTAAAAPVAARFPGAQIAAGSGAEGLAARIVADAAAGLAGSAGGEPDPLRAVAATIASDGVAHLLGDAATGEWAGAADAARYLTGHLVGGGDPDGVRWGSGVAQPVVERLVGDVLPGEWAGAAGAAGYLTGHLLDGGDVDGVRWGTGVAQPVVRGLAGRAFTGEWAGAADPVAYLAGHLLDGGSLDDVRWGSGVAQPIVEGLAGDALTGGWAGAAGPAGYLAGHLLDGGDLGDVRWGSGVAKPIVTGLATDATGGAAGESLGAALGPGVGTLVGLGIDAATGQDIQVGNELAKLGATVGCSVVGTPLLGAACGLAAGFLTSLFGGGPDDLAEEFAGAYSDHEDTTRNPFARLVDDARSGAGAHEELWAFDDEVNLPAGLRFAPDRAGQLTRQAYLATTAPPTTRAPEAQRREEYAHLARALSGQNPELAPVADYLQASAEFADAAEGRDEPWFRGVLGLAASTLGLTEQFGVAAVPSPLTVPQAQAVVDGAAGRLGYDVFDPFVDRDVDPADLRDLDDMRARPRPVPPAGGEDEESSDDLYAGGWWDAIYAAQEAFAGKEVADVVPDTFGGRDDDDIEDMDDDEVYRTFLATGYLGPDDPRSSARRVHEAREAAAADTVDQIRHHPLGGHVDPRLAGLLIQDGLAGALHPVAFAPREAPLVRDDAELDVADGVAQSVRTGAEAVRALLGRPTGPVVSPALLAVRR